MFIQITYNQRNARFYVLNLLYRIVKNLFADFGLYSFLGIYVLNVITNCFELGTVCEQKQITQHFYFFFRVRNPYTRTVTEIFKVYLEHNKMK